MNQSTINSADLSFFGSAPTCRAAELDADASAREGTRRHHRFAHTCVRAFAHPRSTALLLLAFAIVSACCFVWSLPSARASTSELRPDHVGIGSFSASLFKFKKTQEDDGVGFGWQETQPSLKFADSRQSSIEMWSCTINIGMPLRTVKMGKIAADWAATATAEIATTASSAVMHSKSSWVPAAFCKAFKDQMNAIFGKTFPNLGARVTYIK
jgi:hypothetical protein